MHQTRTDGAGTLNKTIICPPLEIRNIIDRTALFTARNGPHFEERIRENECNNIRFCFLSPNDPYHAYYENKVNEIKEGKIPEKTDTQQEKAEQEEQPIEEEILQENIEPYEFELELPDISAKDFDIIKLTARFTARCGNSFPETILKRESHVYQFNFLKPNHSLYPLFNTLVNYYSKILVPSKQIMDKLSRYANNKHDIINSLMVKVRYRQHQEKLNIEIEKEVGKERIAYASIDWHDFVVIGTVEFVEADEDLDLALPLKLEDLKIMSLTEKKEMFSFGGGKQESEEEDIEFDDSDDET